MGIVLPLASNLGVSFAEVGGAMAGMSKTGTDASTAATQLRQILSTIAKPTSQANEALAGMGMSAEGIREQIQEEGLFAALETLTDAFDGNIEATTDVFGNVRALSGVLDLMGESVDDNRELFNKMTDDVGVLDEALAVTEDTASFKFQRAMETLKAALLPVGEILLGIGTDLIDQFMPLIDQVGPGLTGVFEGLAPVLQAIAEQLPILFEALAPVVPIFGQLGEIVGKALATAMPVVVSLIELLIPILELLMPVLDVVVGLFQILVTPIEMLLTLLTPFVDTILTPITEAFGLLSEGLGFFAGELEPLNEVMLPALMEHLGEHFQPVIDETKDKLRDMTEKGLQYLVDEGILPAGFALEDLSLTTPAIMRVFANSIIDSLNLVIKAINGTVGAFVFLQNKTIEGLEGLGIDLPDRMQKISFTPIAEIPRMTMADFLTFPEVDPGASILERRFGSQIAESEAQRQEFIDKVFGRDDGLLPLTQDDFDGFRPMASGGIVTGPTHALIGEAGPEAVIPLDDSRFGNTINIHIQSGVGDPVRIGEEVVTAIKRYERASGPVFARA